MGSLPVTGHGDFRCSPRALATNETCRIICHWLKSTENTRIHLWWWELILITFVFCLFCILVPFPPPSGHFSFLPFDPYQFQGVCRQICWNVVYFTVPRLIAHIAQVLFELNFKAIFFWLLRVAKMCRGLDGCVCVAVRGWKTSGRWRDKRVVKVKKMAPFKTTLKSKFASHITIRPSPHKITLRTWLHLSGTLRCV